MPEHVGDGPRQEHGDPRQIGGRPRQIDEAAIVRAGRELGMAGLSLNAVAARLGVSSTALYRHVDGRWGLERLVGESLLEELHLSDDPALDLVPHLVAFGTGLRASALEHPGLAAYLQTLFPPARAAGACSPRRSRRSPAVATPPTPRWWCAAGWPRSRSATPPRRTSSARAERGAVHRSRRPGTGLHADARLDPAHTDLPQVGPAQHARLMLTVVAQGLVAAAPPGRPVDEVIAALEAVAPGQVTPAQGGPTGSEPAPGRPAQGTAAPTAAEVH